MTQYVVPGSPTVRLFKTAFNVQDAQRAHDTWGANCGPGALAGILGVSLEQIRPWLGDFERKGYTNPTLMTDILYRLGVRWANRGDQWPAWGFARIQWHGPWMEPGVPIQARYRQTHWVGCWKAAADDIGIFDINCINNGLGWIGLAEWKNVCVPWLTKSIRRADGTWSITHSLDLEAVSVDVARAKIIGGRA